MNIIDKIINFLSSDDFGSAVLWFATIGLLAQIGRAIYILYSSIWNVVKMLVYNKIQPTTTVGLTDERNEHELQ